MTTKMLALEDIEPEGKTILLRVDMNTPVDPKSGKLMELNRIAEASVTIRDLRRSKVVVASHQGRVGRNDFISLDQHAAALSKLLGNKVRFVEDIFGPTAREAIGSLSEGEVLLLDNLRLAAEENQEFTPKDAANTVMVQRLYKQFDAFVLDAFPTAHRSSPSIVGFAELLPTCGGRLVAKELKALNRILTIAKGIYTTVLGGAKISDRLEAIDTLIENKRADKVLLTGLIANIFLQASDQIKDPLGIPSEDKYLKKAKQLLADYPGVFELPVDIAIQENGSRLEIPVRDLKPGQTILDIGSRTIDSYSRIIRGSGTVFMSGPPGAFENPDFGKGTEELLRAMASSLGTTIISGGHLTAALERYGVREWIDHVSTAGGALVLFLAGKKLPLFEALDRAARRNSQ
ncbi:MAG: phosphoglycerate kinase [Thaumarchaeota archaeon]|nr:phosphoglycerate kinase [Nitrososphaerota archaeon]MCL5317521.1 phosphoglycerate kinase [Nitrososphaerota archaeon]